ncbi:hypothetical protein GP486_002868 [Trichoglossum hirsutum]|uniref:Uncharacterized protein n=1 Tax=Trichoglossum hirsutum TaxID=265104 RepID=A0A9P8LEE6_9PEZI|nr:hypothetical protein GP486_002868 [Trichoglossum hirsutum]
MSKIVNQVCKMQHLQSFEEGRIEIIPVENEEEGDYLSERKVQSPTCLLPTLLSAPLLLQGFGCLAIWGLGALMWFVNQLKRLLFTKFHHYYQIHKTSKPNSDIIIKELFSGTMSYYPPAKLRE